MSTKIVLMSSLTPLYTSFKIEIVCDRCLLLLDVQQINYSLWVLWAFSRRHHVKMRKAFRAGNLVCTCPGSPGMQYATSPALRKSRVGYKGNIINSPRHLQAVDEIIKDHDVPRTSLNVGLLLRRMPTESWLGERLMKLPFSLYFKDKQSAGHN